MPEDLNIYVTTASNAEESSWGTYCPGMEPSPPSEYITCLGDLYSVSWMEDRQAPYNMGAVFGSCLVAISVLVGQSYLKFSFIIWESQAKSMKKYYGCMACCAFAVLIYVCTQNQYNTRIAEYSMELVHQNCYFKNTETFLRIKIWYQFWINVELSMC